MSLRAVIGQSLAPLLHLGFAESPKAGAERSGMRRQSVVERE